jgi:2-keto-myo-inositol isomerase
MINRSNFGLNRIICSNYNLKDLFQLANELELNYIELRNDLPGKGITDSLSANKIKKLAKQNNLQICSINALQRFNNPEELKKIKDDLLYLLNMAREINCPAIVMCPTNISNDYRSPKEQFHDTVKILKELAPIFDIYNVIGYVEPLGFKSSSLSSVITAMKAIKEVGYEGYKIVFDTFHHAIGPDNLEKFSDEYDVKLTGIIHVSAVTADLPPEEYGDEHRNIDFLNDKMKSKEQIEYFVKRGYDSIISFEPFSRDLQELDKEELKNRINMAIKHLIPEITV